MSLRCSTSRDSTSLLLSIFESTDRPTQRCLPRLAFDREPLPTTPRGALTFTVYDYRIGNMGEENEIASSIETDESEGDEAFGLISLLKTVLAPSTLPHLLLLIFATTGLFLFTKSGSTSFEIIAAMCFISLCLSYAITAYLSGNEAIGRILRTTPYEINAEGDGPSRGGKGIYLLKQILKAWAMPLSVAGALLLLLIFLLGDEGPLSGVGSSLPTILASLFVLWSIGQGVSFKSSATTYISERLNRNANVDRRGSFPVTAGTMILANLIFGGALIFLFVSIQDSELNTDAVEATMLKHVLYLIALLVSQGAIIWWSKPFIEAAITSKRAAKFSMQWGIMVQAFAAWHLMSIYRQYAMQSPEAFTILEELFLMIFTVLLAIWGATKGGMAKGSTVFTKENALFWGLAFGFGYAGSITMVANVLGDVKAVLMAGHAITWVTLLILHRRALRSFVYSEGIPVTLNPKEPESKSTSADTLGGDENTTEVEEEAKNEVADTNATGEAIGDDTQVNWDQDQPAPIESSDDWGESPESAAKTEGEIIDDDELDDDLELID